MISVGIDVSKGKSVLCILKPGGEIVKPPLEIDHTADELDSLVSLINSFEEETRVVLEDTGHYHLPVASYLSTHNIFVCCVNALRMKKYCSRSIRRAKTDKIDAVRIASFGITCWDELVQAYAAPNTYDPYDNAVMECFFRYLKHEETDRRSYSSLSELQDALFRYIHGFYNPFRPHAHNNGLAPIAAEALVT